ncbi:serine/arginine repetitive matrix protein 1 isoform X2 [Rhodamnia argentea]|uniref:Serine/arginine repetitive matrix protein 1 isoform X2 n=1 Tax=Rhodamnia argentea TaxID=178133 RepID=A0ABM3HL20_9MYRT|nr:serine/arginine repetitive matrix protein 1 isoform X2 [Rhodamnia argentea]
MVMRNRVFRVLRRIRTLGSRTNKRSSSRRRSLLRSWSTWKCIDRPNFVFQVDMAKVKMDVMKPWIATRVTELLGFEDEVLINFIYGLLDGKEVNGKEVQIQLTGFMEKNTGKFMKELWTLLLSAQKNTSGVPQQFLDAKEEESRKKQVEANRIADEIRKNRDKESREFEEEKSKRMDGVVEMKASNDALEKDFISSRASNVRRDDRNNNGRRGASRRSHEVLRSHSADHSSSPLRASPSRSNSKSFSKSRSYSDERRRSRSISASRERRSRSVSSGKGYRAPRRRSMTPRRRYSPRRSQSPRRGAYYYRRRSISLNRRSPSPVRRRLHSPPRHRSRSPVKRRSLTPVRRRRSPSPVRRRRSPSPVRRGSPSFERRRSPPLLQRRSSLVRRRSPSPVRRRSPSPARRRLPSPVRRRLPFPARHRSPSPRHRISPSPVSRRSSPVRHLSTSPMHRKSSPPVRHGTPSPVRERLRRSQSISGQRSPSPRQRRSPLSVRRKSMTPPPQRTSHESNSASPIGHRSPSLLKRSPPYGRSPAGSTRERMRSPSPYESPVKQARNVRRRSRSPLKQVKNRVNNDDVSISLRSRERRSHQESPDKSNERGINNNNRESRDRALKPRDKRSMNSSSFSKQGDSPMKVHDKDISPPERAAGDHSIGSKGHSDGLDVRNRDQERMREKPSGKGVLPPSLNKESGEKLQTSHSVEGRKSDDRNRSRDGIQRHRSEVTQRSVEKVDHSKHSSLSETGSEESDKHINERKEKKRHKRLDKREKDSDDNSYDSEIENRKETKRRRKEEKKMRKEERRRRREERRRRREERRAEKMRMKKEDIVLSDYGKHSRDASSLDDEDVDRKAYRSYDEEADTKQKKLEIELRMKALESFKAKKGIGH